jgi:FlaA1/EpsC-like NDP-sugar epimerase
MTNTNILITGGSGSWGRELTKQLLERNPAKITIFSRGEISQVDMERKFNNPVLDFVIGDVRDQDAVEKVMKGIDYVFHLAALKHVPICENLPYEAIQTNITGTRNPQQSKDVYRCVY